MKTGTSQYSFPCILLKRCSIDLDSHLCYRGFMFYLCYLYLLKHTGVQQDFHSRWCSCRLSVTWVGCHTWSRNRYPFLRTWVPPVLVGYTFSFLCTVLSFCLFFLLAIVSSVIRFTASGLSFGIFKLLIQLKKGPEVKHLNNLKCCHPKD